MHPGFATDMSAGESREPDGQTEELPRRLVLVPLEVGPIVPLERGDGSRARDELDELVDEMFGPSTEERPGPFDLVLLIGGALLLAWAILAGGPAWVAVIGLGALVLGAALPARSLVRRYRHAAATRRLRAARGRGHVLDATSDPTAALVAAQATLRTAAARPGSIYSGRALVAGHTACVEVATLLGGAPPDGAVQEEYVAKRTAAILALAAQLDAAHRRWLDDQAASAAEESDRRRRWVAAVTRARDELQAEDRLGSLAQLEQLTTRLTRETDDAGA